MQRVAISFGLAVLSLLASYAIAATWPDAADQAGLSKAAPANAAKATPAVMVGLAN